MERVEDALGSTIDALTVLRECETDTKQKVQRHQIIIFFDISL